MSSNSNRHSSDAPFVAGESEEILLSDDNAWWSILTEMEIEAEAILATETQRFVGYSQIAEPGQRLAMQYEAA